MAHEHATEGEEHYLETIFWLEEAGLAITGANIARAQQVSPPTVHEMVGRLVNDGYVQRNSDKSLGFTESGREHASHIVRRHRMIERFLTDVLGIPWDEVHEEAERIEHAMSPVLEERMRAAIGDATTCPHGHPIIEGAREQGSLLADVEVGADVVVLRFENEAEELLHYLRGAGLEPGLEGKLESSDEESVTIASVDGKLASSDEDRVVISSADGDHEVSLSVAETVSVRADPAPPPRAAIP
ncbi:MAG TPA: metal-dependent transcriptional regulator, partial [Thermoleophilaceae bacterium]|nr:metal-dependent transcriptional regulator [Thermoleophilaceae bacterium]